MATEETRAEANTRKGRIIAIGVALFVAAMAFAIFNSESLATLARPLS